MEKKQVTSQFIEDSNTIVRKYVSKYNQRFREHGVSYMSLGWTVPERAKKRHVVMRDVIRWKQHDDPITLLDFGCGFGHLMEYLDERVSYSGVDIMPQFIRYCEKHRQPGVFHLLDTEADYQDGLNRIADFDYIVANGLFTERLDISYSDMMKHFMMTIRELFKHTRHGLAFNVMSTHLDQKRDDLFHVSMDWMADFLVHDLSRNFIFRNDYGMYEYTAYVYK